MEIIGFIILLFIGVICLGVFGWILKLLGYVLEFAIDGCMEGFGCLIWIILAAVILIGLGL